MKSQVLTRLTLILSLSAMACDTGPKEGEEHIYYAEKLNHEEKNRHEGEADEEAFKHVQKYPRSDRFVHPSGQQF